MDNQPLDLAARADTSIALHLQYVEVVVRLGPGRTLRQSVSHDAVLLAMEHHAAIATLIRFRHFSAAHALIRPLMEMTFRALWLTYVADFSAIKLFLANKYKPDLDDCARLLDKRGPSELKGFGSAVLDQAHI